MRKVSYQVVDVQESDLSFDCSDHDEQAYHGAEMEVPGKLQMGLNKCLSVACNASIWLAI